MNPTNDERARFEVWYRKEHGHDPVWMSGLYFDVIVATLWRGWQAARSQSAPAAQGEAPMPFAHTYRFADPISGNPVWRLSSDTWNGQRPLESRALYLAPQPSAPGVVSEAPKKWPGLKDLEYVIERLRETCSFRDEEGDVTDGLESLLNAIKAAQPSADDAPSPEPFRVGNTYRTRGGGFVRFVSVANPGKTYETMVDEFGVHRYTNRVSPLDRGRVTGMAHGDNSVVSLYAAPPADARDADDARPIPTPDEARNGWYVAFGAHGVDLLTLSSDGSYRGLGNIDDYADIVRSAARTLRAFVGVTDPIADAWPECSGDPACCPENEGYGCCKPIPSEDQQP